MLSTGFDMFAELPAELSETILLNWLDLVGLSTLDVAYCNHFKRNDLLALYKAPQFIITELPSEECTPSFLEWALQRSIKAEKVLINRGLYRYIEYMKQHGQYVKRIEFNRLYYFDCQLMIQLFQSCPNLRVLVFESCWFEPAEIETLVHCRSLQELHLKGDRDGTLDSTAKFQVPEVLQLTTLELNCEALIAKMVLKMTSSATLRRLKVEWSDASVAPAVHSKLKQCKELETFCMDDAADGGDSRMLDSEFAAMISACPQVQHFETRSIELTDARVTAIARTFRRLKSLRLPFCDLSSDQWMELVEGLCDSLTSLYICSAPRDLNTALSRCHQLRTLWMTFDKRFSCDYSLFKKLEVIDS